MAGSPELSLIIPLHDEAENVDPTVEACVSALAELERPFELILVDDGSTDATRASIRSWAERDERVRALGLRRRFGKGAALAAGVEAARGSVVATIDGDLQEDPAELAKLLAALEEGEGGADLVTGWRADRRDGPLKKLQSALFNGVVRIATGQRVHDLNCGFKVMTRELADELRLTDGRFRFVSIHAHAWGYRTLEVPVTHRPRTRGRSSFGANRFPGVFIDLLLVLALVRYQSRPGHLFIQLGGLAGLLGLVICGYLATLRLVDGSIGFRYPLLALGVLLVVIGTQLVATGFLGEWLSQQRAGSGGGEDPGFRVGWRSDDERSS